MTGMVHIVGAGPGAADLLTVRAARLIAQADVVLHDALVSEEILALASAQARLINVGKRANRASTDQAVINRLLVQAAGRDQTVVRLKGGDPAIFARAQEEIEACRRAGVSVCLVPGVTAACAAAAELGVSLTARGFSRSVAFVTPAKAKGAAPDDHWVKAAANAETAVIYMGKGEAGTVRDALIAQGVPASRPAALAADASRPECVLARGTLGGLEALAAAVGAAPTVLIIGAVASLAQAAGAAPDEAEARRSA